MDCVNDKMSALSAQMGSAIDLSSGAVRLTLGGHGPWWLEVDPDGLMLTIHHTVADYVPGEAGHWLAINSEVHRMGGAWLALHTPTATIRLVLLLELNKFDAQDVLNVMSNLVRLRSELPEPAQQRTMNGDGVSNSLAI